MPTYQEVTDPEVLKAFGIGVGPTASSRGRLSRGVTEETDPNIPSEFGIGADAPAARSSVTEETDPAIIQQFLGTAPAAQEEPVGQGKDVGTYGAFVTGFASNENEKVRYLAHKLYPNEKIDEAVKRFGKRNGVLIHRADDGKLYEAIPYGMGTVASSVGPSIPLGTGLAAGAVTAPIAMTGVGFPAAVAATGASAAGGEVIRQKVGDLLMGDAATQDVAPLPVVEQAALGATGQAAGAGMGAFANRFAVRDVGNFNPAATQQAYREANQAGVPITPAEATGLPSLGAQQKHLTNLTATGDKMRAFLNQRNVDVRKTWDGYLDSISVGKDAEDVGRMVRDAAKSSLIEMRGTLKQNAKPLYDAAFAKPVPFSRELENLLDLPMMQDAIGFAKNLAENSKVPFRSFAEKQKVDGRKIWEFTQPPTMQELHYIKMGLDELLSSDKVLNKATGGMNNLGRIATERKQDLLRILDDAVPEYKVARQAYSDGMEEVTSGMQSALKILADTKDVNVLDAARHIFNPKTRSPQMVEKLRYHLERKDPNAWQSVKRLYMHDATVDALRISEQGDIPNVAGKLHKAFTNEKVKENLFAAMSPAEKSRYHLLMKVFKRAASVQSLRSDTAYNAEALEAMRKAATPISAKVAKNLNPAQALRSFEQWRTDKNLERHADVAVDLITSGDPEALKAMRELRKLTVRGETFAVLFGQLLSRTTAFAGGQLLPEADYAPEQQAEQRSKEDR